MSDYKVEKFTDLAVSNLTSGGGKLQDDQSDTFYRKVIDRTGLIGDIRNVQMNSDTMNINKIGLGSMIVRAAPTGSAPYIVDGVGETYGNDRNLASGDRFSPSFEQVQLTVKEYLAEIHLTDDVMENNLEKENITNVILDLASTRIANDMEVLLIESDSTNGALSAAHQLQNGVLKRVTTNVVDAANAGISLDVFADLQTAVPTKYMNNLTSMKYYLHNHKELAWRQALAARGTDLGDANITGTRPVPALGVNLQRVAQMPQSNILFTDPKNIIMGWQRDMRLETERYPRSRITAFIFTFKVGIQLEEEAATAKVVNLG
jgi:HK97 family phage major capsid protein